MSTLTRGNVKMALASVRSTKWRSLLTMLGIIIGIVSVVMVVGIGEGVKREITHQIDQFGKDLITVRPGTFGSEDANGVSASTDLLFGLNSTTSLTEQDLKAVQEADHVRIAAPLAIVPGSVKADDEAMKNGLVLATNADLPQALNRSVSYGDFFGDKEENANVAVIGRNIAQSLFHDQVPLGRSFTFRGHQFIVWGVFNEFKSTPLSPASNFNNAIFIPYKTAEKITDNNVQMYSILAKPDKPEDDAAAISSIHSALLAAHGGEQDFSVLDHEQSIAASSDVLELLTTMIAAVAAISLLVGGVGIMNIMLASVTERTREIGVRKAIGATNRQILNQFVMESAVLSLVGGVVGVLLSLAGVFALRAYTSLNPVISLEAILLATGVSLVIGIIFGATPAIRAAHKDPIEALRHE